MNEQTIVQLSVVFLGVLGAVIGHLVAGRKTTSDTASALRDDLREDREHFKAEAERYRLEAFEATRTCQETERRVWQAEGELQRSKAIAEANAALLVEKDARIDGLLAQVQSLSGIVTQKSQGLERLVAQLETVRSCPLASPEGERVCPIADKLASLGTHPESTPEGP